MTMPSTSAGTASAVSPEGDCDARRAGGTAKRIAIVEDELMVAWALESMAEDLGHGVIGIFSSGETALAAIGEEPTDLVFMDINLGGGMDGIETARRLRRRWPVPILFITAYADPATRERVTDAVPGAMLLGKPVPALALERAIEAVAASE